MCFVLFNEYKRNTPPEIDGNIINKTLNAIQLLFAIFNTTNTINTSSCYVIVKSCVNALLPPCPCVIKRATSMRN